MIGKPFRPPLLRKVERSEESAIANDDEPQTKKRRTNDDYTKDGTQKGPQLVFKKPGISSLPRKPLLAVENLAATKNVTESSGGGIEGYYNVLWYGMILY